MINTSLHEFKEPHYGVHATRKCAPEELPRCLLAIQKLLAGQRDDSTKVPERMMNTEYHLRVFVMEMD